MKGNEQIIYNESSNMSQIVQVINPTINMNYYKNPKWF